MYTAQWRTLVKIVINHKRRGIPSTDETITRSFSRRILLHLICKLQVQEKTLHLNSVECVNLLKMASITAETCVMTNKYNVVTAENTTKRTNLTYTV